jgi:hypothetical protein
LLEDRAPDPEAVCGCFKIIQHCLFLRSHLGISEALTDLYAASPFVSAA